MTELSESTFDATQLPEQCCNEDSPRKVGLQEAGPRKGDLMCPECNFMNFSRSAKCLKCQAEGPERVVVKEIKKGDWNCSQCNFRNFSGNAVCKKCGAKGPIKVSADHLWKRPQTPVA
ncbi:Zinc finger protein VAR3, chloroplastic-like protein [Drosera capensis]